MAARKLGKRIRGLRLKAEISLRGLARRVKISAAHMSDIEHDRRMPSDDVLHRIVAELAHVGAKYEELRLLKPQIEEDLQEWYEKDPEVRALFREAKDSGLPAREILKALRDQREKAEEDR